MRDAWDPPKALKTYEIHSLSKQSSKKKKKKEHQSSFSVERISNVDGSR